METLVQQILDENEKHPAFEFTVYSTSTREAAFAARAYRHSNFVFLRSSPAADFMFRVRNKIQHVFYAREAEASFIRRVLSRYRPGRNGLIFVDNRPEYVLPLARRFPGQRIVLHQGNDTLNASTIDGAKILSSCHRVLTLSGYLRNCVLAIGPKATEKVTVSPFAVDLDNFCPERGADLRLKKRDALGITKNRFVVIYCGRINHGKGVHLLVEAIRNLSSAIPVSLLVVGSSWYKGSNKDAYVQGLEESAKGLEDRILFTGYVDNACLPELYGVADVAVVPSIWEEPAGLVSAEAMAMGLPVVTTDAGGIPEIVSPNCAFIMRRDEPIVPQLERHLSDLYSDPRRRDEMGAAARARAERLFSSRDRFERFTTVFAEMGENAAHPDR